MCEPEPPRAPTNEEYLAMVDKTQAPREVPEIKRKQCNEPQAPGREWQLKHYDQAGELGEAQRKLALAREALEFVHKHLESMDNYSVVSGARHVINETMEKLK